MNRFVLCCTYLNECLFSLKATKVLRPPNLCLWDIDFKLIIRNKRLRKNLPSMLFCIRRFGGKNSL